MEALNICVASYLICSWSLWWLLDLFNHFILLCYYLICKNKIKSPEMACYCWWNLVCTYFEEWRIFLKKRWNFLYILTQCWSQYGNFESYFLTLNILTIRYHWIICSLNNRFKWNSEWAVLYIHKWKLINLNCKELHLFNNRCVSLSGRTMELFIIK